MCESGSCSRQCLTVSCGAGRRQTFRQNLARALNLFSAGEYVWNERNCPDLPSGQEQIGEPDQGGGEAGRDQGVIDAEIALRIERWLPVLSRHGDRLKATETEVAVKWFTIPQQFFARTVGRTGQR